MTNADTIRAMSNEELGILFWMTMHFGIEGFHAGLGRTAACSRPIATMTSLLNWLETAEKEAEA